MFNIDDFVGSFQKTARNHMKPISEHQFMFFLCSHLQECFFAKKVCCLRDTASCYLLIVAIGSRQFDVGFLLRNVLSACHCDVAMLCWFIYDIQVVVEKI